MRQKWVAALSGTIALSLLVGNLPVVAKKQMEREAKRAQIEAKQDLSLRSYTSSKKLSRSDESSRLVIIQFDGPIEDEWKERIEDLGVQLGDYLPDFAFIAKLEKEKDRDAIKRLSFVKKVLPFQPVYKLAPELRSTLTKRSDVEVAVIGFDKAVDIRKTLNKIGTRGISSIETKKGARHVSELRLSGDGIEELLNSDDIIAVLPIPERKIHNDSASRIIHSDILASTGYTGDGQIVGIADTGLDSGDVDRIHPDFVGRVKKLYAHTNPGDAADHNGHGTHVAGSVVGTGAASDGTYKGMAPDAKLVFHAIATEGDRVGGNLNVFLDEAYGEGARIHSDSWGSDDEGEYSIDSYLFDKFIWDHPDLTALIAAGNSGVYGYETVGSPATAKNVIAVGASENLRPEINEDSDNEDDIAYFSSLGPTIDGRFKPDIVAPGTAILSTRSSIAPDDNFMGPFNSYYAYMQGTSMATPILAGGTAQIRQFLVEKGYEKPSGALIKSMIITGADVLDTVFEAQGYGRANLQNAIETGFIDETAGLRTKGKASYAIKVTDRSKPLAITLAWTDYPGSLIAQRALVNDLNLKVIAPSGKKYNGNDFFEEPYNDEVDNVNNVEQVWLTKPETGTYTVTIEGYNIPKGPQPYALSTTGTLVPADIKEETKKGTIGTARGKRKYIDYRISVRKPGTVKLSAEWNSDADVNLHMYDSKSKEVSSATSQDNPEKLEFKATKAGTYKVRVQIKSGDTASYTLSLSYPGKK